VEDCLSRLRRSGTRCCGSCPEHIQPAGGAGLLSLEPGSQTIPVEDVAAGQLLGGGGGHLLPADDAHVVCGGKLLSRGVRIKGVHVVDRPS